MIRLSNSQIASVYADLSACGREACDHKYPCGDGGWLHYRIVSEEGLADALRLRRAAAKIARPGISLFLKHPGLFAREAFWHRREKRMKGRA